MMRRLTDRLNHEYWPWWLIYLPVFPLYFWQALRMRRAAFFTNVNPAIDMGGFFGERKSGIYARLPEDCYPTTVRISAGTPAHEALALAYAAGIAFPLIVKPDVGERGEGVRKLFDRTRMLEALGEVGVDMLVQGLASGNHEFGLMFARNPSTGYTALLSITGKRFLSVTGDGVRDIDGLLALTFRGNRQRNRLGTYASALLQRVPQPGERVQVEPIGNHCRGTTFIDAAQLRTPALENAVNDLLGATTGLYYGRLDVRAESEEALRAGAFTVIELNGVSSEPGHIYDPSWSIWRCWAELVRHVRHIGAISSKLQEQGEEPATLHALVCRCEAHFGWRLGAARRITALFATNPASRSQQVPRPPHGTAAAAAQDVSAPPRGGRGSPVGTAG